MASFPRHNEVPRGGQPFGTPRRAFPTDPSAPGTGASLPLVPVYPRVVRAPTDGDDVRLAVAVQIGHGLVLDRDPAILDNVSSPYFAHAVRGLVDADSAFLGKRIALAGVITNADDQLVLAVAVEVGAPDGMTPAEVVVNHLSVPQ